MFYRTLSELKENHPTFFSRDTADLFGDLRYNKRGDCVVVTERDPYDTQGKTVYKVFDFASGSAMYIGTFDTFKLAEAMAIHTPKMPYQKARGYGRLINAAQKFLESHTCVPYGSDSPIDTLCGWMINARAGNVWLQQLEEVCLSIYAQFPRVDDIAFALSILEED